MGFLDFILSSKNSHKKNFNLDFEVFKSLGAEKYQEIKDEEGKDMQEFEDSIMESRLKSKSSEYWLVFWGRIYVDDSFKIYGSFFIPFIMINMLNGKIMINKKNLTNG